MKMVPSNVFYDRILMGLASEDDRVSSAAEGCLSFFSIHMRRPMMVLPDPVVRMLDRLPETDIYAKTRPRRR